MRLSLCLLASALLLAAPPPPLTLESVRGERDPFKRFDQALKFGEARLKDAWKLVREGGARSSLEAAIEDVYAASELALDALRSTGRRPGKLSRQYKRGELRTREFDKGLQELSLAVGFDERERIEQVRQRLAAIHEQFLQGVMTGR